MHSEIEKTESEIKKLLTQAQAELTHVHNEICLHSQKIEQLRSYQHSIVRYYDQLLEIEKQG